VLLSVSLAHAYPTTRLTYQRGAGAERCPDETALRKAVSARLGYDPFFPWADRTIVARIEADKGVMRGSVELLDEQGLVRGSRKLQAKENQCDELVSGMALAISIAIDPTSLDRGGKAPGAVASEETDPEGEEWADVQRAHPDPSSQPSRERSEISRSPTRPEKPAQLIPELDLGAAASDGLAPSVGIGPLFELGARLGSVSGALTGLYQFVLDKEVGEASVSSSYVEGGLVGCYHIGVAFACARASAGRLAVSGNGINRPGSAAGIVWRVGPRGGVLLPLSQTLGLRFTFDAMFDLGRQIVELDGQETWQSPVLGAVGAVAFHGRFP
jgi:hypothetical protein